MSLCLSVFLSLSGCSETRKHVLQTLAFTARNKHAKNQAAFRACGAIKIPGVPSTCFHLL